MTHDVRRSIIEEFERHSMPIQLGEVIGTRPRRTTPQLRLIVIASAVIVVGLVTAATLLPRLGTSMDSPRSPTTSSPTSTEATVPTTNPSLQPTYERTPFTISEAPAVVHEVPRGALPAFDTSQLGQEMPIVPLEDFQIDDLALDDLEWPLADEPIVALGTVGNVEAFRVPVHAVGEQLLCDWGVGIERLAEPGTGKPYPLGECGFGMAVRPDLTIVGPRRYVSSGSASSGSPWVSQVFWSGLSDDVSVVAISVDGSGSWWQRPVGGTSVFVVESTAEPTIRLTGYSNTGAILIEESLDS